AFPPFFLVGVWFGCVFLFPPPRLAVFISVSRLHQRTPMNNPLRSVRREKPTREAGFDEGCCLN
ncbi:hypothetical protein ACMX24_12875, partial [Caballeronia sp. 15711]